MGKTSIVNRENPNVAEIQQNNPMVDKGIFICYNEVNVMGFGL
jgi:hypothetical protein